MRPILKIPSKKLRLVHSPRLLRHLLIEAVGPYCSYCESPLSVDIPHATKVSVSPILQDFGFDDGTSVQFREGVDTNKYRLAWVNQQLMCSACFLAKGESPGTHQGLTFLQHQHPSLYELVATKIKQRRRLSSDEWDILFTGATQSWISPDHSADDDGVPLDLIGADPTYDLLQYTLSNQTPQTLHANGWLRLTQQELQAGWTQQAQNKVWVLPNNALLNAQDAPSVLLRERAKNTILGLNLNYCNPTAQDAVDRRVDNRTEAFILIQQSVALLGQKVAEAMNQHQAPPDRVLFRLPITPLVQSLRELLQATGFWSLWANELRRAIKPTQGNPIAPWNAIPEEARSRLLYSLLIEYEVDARKITSPLGPTYNTGIIEGRMIMDGTDISRLSFL